MIVLSQPSINVFVEVSMMALQLFLESYTVLPFSTTIELKFEPPTVPSIYVTLAGIVMEVRPLQPQKAPPPMLVTLFGIVMEVRLEQPENAYFPMLVTLFGMVMEVRSQSE